MYLLMVVQDMKCTYGLVLQALVQPTDPEFRPSLAEPEGHVALILFTSGTSGLPKGVMIPDRYLTASIQSWSVNI